jgi:type IV secretion system protein VirD4
VLIGGQASQVLTEFPKIVSPRARHLRPFLLGSRLMADGLHSDFPRGSSGNGASDGPSAAFESTENVSQTTSLLFNERNGEGRVFLGVVGSSIEKARLPDGRIERHALGGCAIGVPDDRHIITIAGSRAGKGRSAIVPNLITYPGSILAIDPKGELAAITADWRAEVLNQRVFVLDPFGVAGRVAEDHGGAFNPLTILTLDSPSLIEDAGLIADALIVLSPGARDPHWDESAKQFLEGVILHVATSPLYDGRRDLVSVYECLMEGLEELKDEMRENSAADFAVLALANAFFDKAETERSGVLSTLRRHIRFLGYGQMKKVLRGHSFDLRDLKTGRVTVYLSLPAMRMGTCSRWLRLFVNLALAAFEVEKRRPAYPVLLCLDEFATLGPMKTLEDAAGQIAGLGCKLWPILQDLGQLEALYEKRWETFLGNAGVLQFFGNSDLRTLEWISKRLGQTTIHTTSQNQPGYDARAQQGVTGQSFSQSVHPLMTAEEISRFFGRDDKQLRQLIIRPTWSPMVLQRAYYDKHELFASYRRFMQQPPSP